MSVEASSKSSKVRKSIEACAHRRRQRDRTVVTDFGQTDLGQIAFAGFLTDFSHTDLGQVY